MQLNGLIVYAQADSTQTLGGQAQQVIKTFLIFGPYYYGDSLLADAVHYNSQWQYVQSFCQSKWWSPFSANVSATPHTLCSLSIDNSLTDHDKHRVDPELNRVMLNTGCIDGDMVRSLHGSMWCTALRPTALAVSGRNTTACFQGLTGTLVHCSGNQLLGGGGRLSCPC